MNGGGEHADAPPFSFSLSASRRPPTPGTVSIVIVVVVIFSQVLDFTLRSRPHLFISAPQQRVVWSLAPDISFTTTCSFSGPKF